MFRTHVATLLAAALISCAVSAEEMRVDAFGYPLDLPDKLALRALLTGRNYDELEETLAELQRAFEADYRHEFRVAHGFDAFRGLDAEGAGAVEQWARQRPDSWVAQLALGRHYVSEAWRQRGSGWASRTSKEQFAAMRASCGRANQVLGRALELRPTLAVAWELRLDCARATSDAELRERALREALAIHPLLFRAREIYMMNATRRWGGSYAELRRLAGDAQAFAEANPRLVLLLGLADWDRGRDAKRCAIEPFDAALAHGAYWRALMERGWCHRRKGELAPALRDLERAVALHPQDADLIHRRGHVFSDLGDWERALADLELAHALDPHDEHIAGLLEWYRGRVRFAEFLGKLTPREAFGWGAALLLLFTTGFGTLGVLLWWIARRSRAALRGDPVAAQELALDPARRVGRRIWRLYTWPIVLIFVVEYTFRWPQLRDVDRLGLLITALAFLGLVGYVKRRRIFGPRFWMLWAWVFPLWNLVYCSLIEKVTLESWPVWGFAQLILLPTYAALFLYGYRSRDLWGDAEAVPLLWRDRAPGPEAR